MKNPKYHNFLDIYKNICAPQSSKFYYSIGVSLVNIQKVEGSVPVFFFVVSFMHITRVCEMLQAAKNIAVWMSFFFLVLIAVINTITWKQSRDINQGSCI